MITEKNHKLLTSQIFVTDCTNKGLASMILVSWIIYSIRPTVLLEIMSVLTITTAIIPHL